MVAAWEAWVVVSAAVSSRLNAEAESDKDRPLPSIELLLLLDLLAPRLSPRL
jgi:fermentation-respiration switch protein FrsA (DUF1100 family)